METMEEVNELIRTPVQLPEDIEMSDCVNEGDRAEKMLLAPPEYNSFRHLAAEMIEVVQVVSGGYCKISIIEEGDGPLVPVNAEIEIHYAAYWENERVPFDSSITPNMGARKKMRLGAGAILPAVDTALSMVRGPAARLMLLAPVLLRKQRGCLPPHFVFEDALFIISLYSVKEVAETLPLEEQKTVNLKTVYALEFDAHKVFEEERRGPTVNNDQFMVGNWTRYFDEEIPVKRLKTGIASLLQNFDYLTDEDIYCKALFYYGKAFQSSARIQKARKFYKQALALEPRNHAIGSTLALLEAYLKKCAVHEAFLSEWGFDMPLTRRSYYFDGDGDFESSIRMIYRDLEERNLGITFELPKGLSNDEEIRVRSLTTDIEGLEIKEKRVGHHNMLSVVSTGMIRELQ